MIRTGQWSGLEKDNWCLEQRDSGRIDCDPFGTGRIGSFRRAELEVRGFETV